MLWRLMRIYFWSLVYCPYTPSANSRGTEHRSAFVEFQMSFLEHNETMGDLCSEQREISSCCRLTHQPCPNLDLVFAFNLKHFLHADFMPLYILLSSLLEFFIFILLDSLKGLTKIFFILLGRYNQWKTCVFRSSEDAGSLVVPRFSKNRLGAKRFSYQASLLWNQLPVSVQRGRHSTFKSRLNKFLKNKKKA